MDSTIIIYIIVDIIIAVFIWLYCSGQTSNSKTLASQLSVENERLKTKLAETEKKLTNSVDLENELDKIELKYKALLKEANEQCAQLDEQLKNAIDGKIDNSFKEQLAQTEKLKKEIKDLKEEIEENEDDISNLNNKIESKNEEYNELLGNLRKEKKKTTNLGEELSSARQALEEKVEELKIKMGSLDFIQEILSAKEISTEDTQKLYKRINTFESFVKGSYLDLNSYLYNSYDNIPWKEFIGKQAIAPKKQYVIDHCDQWTATKRKSWLDGKRTIAFVGEFSAGKTSIVNRILTQDNPDIPKLPVSTKATTAIPTYIAGGSVVSYSFISGDGRRKEILEETFKKVSKEVLDQIKGVSSLIKYFVMTYKNPNLNGLSILDTPGFNSNDSEDRDRTIDVINECDALFWVFDVNAGTVNRSSISIIKEKLNKPLYIVINKIDTKSESEIQKVEELIQKTLEEEGLKVEQFIRFSAKASIEDIMTPIHSVKKIESRENFISEIKEDLEHLLKVFKEKVDEQNKSYIEEYQNGYNIIDDLEEDFILLYKDCEAAKQIPRWETHLFSSDRYEMSKEEYDQLIQLLDFIAEERPKIIDPKIKNLRENAEKAQEAYSMLRDRKSAWQNINDCLEQYKKITKEL
ncbi:dynamin family protein [Prevotella melaninogenica]|uniref:dynamin family protein n=1 Tax=Prevotella melaninogenica TaxID=28132 RepID=UPI001C5DBAE4|nr:dynamin family protein [Prevotella melaninogenica]MBW4722964.1 dynamin family protein [Prevotella melaninogenica]